MPSSHIPKTSAQSAKVRIAIATAAIFIAAFSTPAIAGSYGSTSDPLEAAPNDNVDLPYLPAEANSDFSVPYSDALGSGGQSWRGLLSGTMQTTAPCVTSNQATQAGGSASTSGSIAVYKSASEVAHALSVSGSAGYKGVARVKVSAGFSSSSSQSSNSIYAVASVYTNMGMVNMGRQTLLPEIDALARQIDSVPDAMRFISRCGDSYARGFTQGASWISVLEISSSSSSSSSDIYASVSGRYAGFSASANFNRSASSQSSNSSFVLTEQCNGPLFCGEATVSGQSYTPPGSCTSTNCELATFTNNFNYMMKGGLAGACAASTSTATSPSGLTISGPDAAKCVVAVQYAPIADLLSSVIPPGGSSRDDLASMDDLVIDEPKAPRILVSGGNSTSVLPPQNSQVTVVVTPSKKGGQPDSFIITATNTATGAVAGTCSADNSVSDTPHCVVLGLANGVQYSFSAQAVNSAATSAPSNVRFSTPSAQAINPTTDPVLAQAVINAAANNVASSLSIAQNLQKTMSPSELVRAAAYGAFGVQRNLSNWASEYQTIYNAESENELYNQTCGAVAPSKYCSNGAPARVTIENQLGVTTSDQMTDHWKNNIRNLNRQAVSCSREYLSINPGCTGRATACWISSLDVASYTNEECQPNAFASNELLFIANPFDISSLLQGNDELSPEVLEDATDFAGDRLGVYTTGSAVAAQTVSVGGAHSCALMQDTTVQCWGLNNFGQLGVGQLNPPPIPPGGTPPPSGGGPAFTSYPVKVPGLTGVRQIAAARNHTCALTTQGLVYCWGLNNTGQLGIGTTVNQSSPQLVTGLSAVKQIAVGGGDNAGHSCALLNTGQVRCWGYNAYNQVSAGSWSYYGQNPNALVPVVVNNLPAAQYIALGGWHSCAILANSVNSQCWGYGGEYQLGYGGNGTGGPAQMQGYGFTQIALGNRHTCGIVATTIYCLGYNGYGQLGNGNTSTQPNYVIPGKTSQLSLGLANTTCVIGTDLKSAYCWGANAAGQLGDGTTTNRAVPTQVQGLAGAPFVIATGGYEDATVSHTCAVLSTGSVQCWGLNQNGQLGNGTTKNSTSPQTVTFSS